MWTGAHADDGPKNVHVVLLDNGRTRALADPVGRQALRCIRCSACLNVCPVYERVGGKAYGSVYPGPIGAILNPLLHGVDNGPVERSLPFASTLCGRCFEVCPVRIDIPEVLIHLRGRVVEETHHGVPRSRGNSACGPPASCSPSPGCRALRQRALGLVARALRHRSTIGALPIQGWAANWTGARDIPVPPRQSFRRWWRRSHKTQPPTPTQRSRQGAKRHERQGRHHHAHPHGPTRRVLRHPVRGAHHPRNYLRSPRSRRGS